MIIFQPHNIIQFKKSLSTIYIDKFHFLKLDSALCIVTYQMTIITFTKSHIYIIFMQIIKIF